MANPTGKNQYSGMSAANVKLAKRQARWDKEAKDRRDGKPKVSKTGRFKTTYGFAGGGKLFK